MKWEKKPRKTRRIGATLVWKRQRQRQTCDTRQSSCNCHVKLQSASMAAWPRCETYQVFQKTETLFYFCDNWRKCALILTIFYRYNKISTGHKSKLRRTPHLYYVTSLPSKTHLSQNWRYMCVLSMLMV